jgi:predicted alpha/beta-fold hydrolase
MRREEKKKEKKTDHISDDPIASVKASPVRFIEENENLFYLITKSGGHVGWPCEPDKHVGSSCGYIGWLCGYVGWLCGFAITQNGWQFQSNSALTFFETIKKIRENEKK